MLVHTLRYENECPEAAIFPMNINLVLSTLKNTYEMHGNRQFSSRNDLPRYNTSALRAVKKQ